MTTDASVWTVLKIRRFRALWLAGLTSMVGMWMQSLGAAWLMTELTPSPVMVGLIQGAQMFPSLSLGLITGALVDLFDRRRFLMAVMAWQVGVTLVLALLTFTGLITPWLLIACIFAVGIGNACQGPAMSANLQEIVPREDIVGAVTLNAMALNISRSIGPALAGLLVGIAGEGPAFLVNSACYGSYYVAVARNVPARTSWSGGHQGLRQSIMGGIRYARKARRFQAVLIRGFTFFMCGSLSISMLPVMARRELHIGPQQFGTLLGFVGVGALITGFWLMGLINKRFSRDAILFWGSLIVAAATMNMAWTRNYWVFAASLMIFGGAWMICMISVQIAAQMVLPAWVRGRGLSITMMSISGGLVAGSVGWGTIADHFALSTTYTAASLTLTAMTLLTRRYNISGNEPEEG